ncbi:hypothetical protein SDJN02_01185, partial [Cucurbita argyrosperma subsp. argyrosperma]
MAGPPSLSGPIKMKFAIGRSSGRGATGLRHKLSRLTQSVSFEIEVSIVGFDTVNSDCDGISHGLGNGSSSKCRSPFITLSKKNTLEL